MSTRAVILADTHFGPGKVTFPEPVLDALRSVDVILHAGDITCAEVLDTLSSYGPVHAVLGNNDHTLVGKLPERLVLDVSGVQVAMVHDSGPSAGRGMRLHRWFPDADLVVFGHSHMPQNEVGVDGQRIFNPGSPTQRRRAPTRTFGRLEAHGGRIETLETLHVGP